MPCQRYLLMVAAPTLQATSSWEPVPPVRYSLAKNPFFQNNRFIKLGLDNSDQWWTPPYDYKHWTNFQDKIPPYWQETLREKITVKEFHAQGAKFLRGQA